MEITIHNTSQMVSVEVPGHGVVPARVWEGTTSSGIPVMCLVTRIAVKKDQDTSQFERELQEQRAPSPAAIECFLLRMVL